MSEVLDAKAQTLPGDLLRDLHGFLSLEAPFLIRDLPRADSEKDLEAALVDRLTYRFRTGPKFADTELYPGLTHQQAVGRTQQQYESAIRGFFERRRIQRSLTTEERKLMLRTMLLTRAVDDHLKQAFDRKDVKWRDYPSPQKGFRSTGQEAIVGTALRLRRPPAYPAGADYEGDYICPLIRDLGALLMFMPDPLHPILVQYGKDGTPVGGRDLHTGDFDHGVLPPAAPLAIGTQTLLGLAYGFQLRGEDRLGVSFIGEGGSSLGEWHEALNFAAVRRLNLVFVIENNQWALGTHVSEQSRASRFALKAAGYGIPGVTVFGNDPDQVAAAATWAAERARLGEGPTLLELVSYRRPGHAHHDDDRFHGSSEAKIPGYEYSAERTAWEAVDPVDLYRRRLAEAGVISVAQQASLEEALAAEVAAAAEIASDAPWPRPEVYRSSVHPGAVRAGSETGDWFTKRMSYDEAIRDALREAMVADRKVFVLGEDVGGRYGGAFGVTRGLAKQFGDERCLNTPLAESAIVGCGVGAALMGFRPVVEMQFADFLAPAFNALVNNAAKLHWRWGRPVPLVVRLPYGGSTGASAPLLGGGPFHSQCPEMWFVRTPGWRVVAPATPRDAKGLLLAAIDDDSPVIFLEAKGLYGFFRTDLREEVPVGGEFRVPIGRAAVRREGDDLTLVTYGAMVWTALEASRWLGEEGIEVEVIDLRTLVPLDEETLFASVRKTNRVLVLHEDTRRGGLAGELAALITEHLFFHLDAPIRRVTAPDTPVPYSPPLELDYLPQVEEVVEAARRLAHE
ncbi:MAG: thiamine pyrophosphate-dependent enzyme [Acidobacteria bacterium]|nr:thiamine pyrophosphate-dependent enzyme [Acidobacteriota bacterium]